MAALEERREEGAAAVSGCMGGACCRWYCDGAGAGGGGWRLSSGAKGSLGVYEGGGVEGTTGWTGAEAASGWRAGRGRWWAVAGGGAYGDDMYVFRRMPGRVCGAVGRLRCWRRNGCAGWAAQTTGIQDGMVGSDAGHSWHRLEASGLRGALAGLLEKSVHASLKSEGVGRKRKGLRDCVGVGREDTQCGGRRDGTLFFSCAHAFKA